MGYKKNKGFNAGTGGAGGGGSSSGSIKVLNVNMVGTLNRDDDAISGFSQSNYLTLSSRLNNNYLNLDNSFYTKDFGEMIKTADSWEMIIKFKFKTQTVSDNFICLFTNCTAYGTSFGFSSNYKPYAAFSNSGSSYNIGTITGTTTLVNNTIYYLKICFTGTTYQLYLSTDGINYVQEGNDLESQTKIEKRDYWRFGSYIYEARQFNGILYVGGTSIKSNGEYWWRGVEEIQL